MKRWRRLLIAVLILLLALAGTAYWAATTPQGLHFLLKAVSVFSPVHLQAREIKGSLTDSNLKVTGLTIRWDKVEIACAALDLDWQPGELRQRNLFVKRIHAQGISIRDRRPALTTSPKFVWPVVSWVSWINGRADDVQAEDLNYRRLDEPPVAVATISASLALEKGVLQVKDMRIFSPEGRGEATASVSFAQPELRLRIKAFPTEKYAHCDSFSASLDLSPGKRNEQSAGPVLISGSQGDSEVLRLEGRVALTSTALTFQDFQLIQPGRKGSVKGKGEWVFANKAGLTLQVLFSQFDLEREIGRKTVLSGNVDFKGSPSAFEGSFRIANQGEGWQAASLEGNFQGAGKKVSIQDLKGEWLKGRISGTASIGWQDRVTAEASLRGRNLDPGAFGKSGPLNLDLEGKLHFPKGENPVGDFQVRLAEKEGDRGAKAVLKVRLKEKATHTASFSLNLPRGEVRASLSGAYHEGILREVIESLEGKDPSGNWVMQGPTQVQVSSRELKVMPMRLSSPRGEKVKLAAQLQFDPLRGAVEAAWQQIDLARANQFFEKDHIAGRTRGEVTARWEKNQGWQVAGTANLEGKFIQDSMTVQVPAGRGKITWDERGLLANLDLRIGGGGKVQGKVTSPEPVGLGLPAKGRTEVAWRGIDLEILQAILPSALRFQGQVSGHLQGEWLPEFRLQGSGEAAVSKGKVIFPLRERPIQVGLEKGDLSFTLNQDRLSGTVDLTLKDHGLLKGSYALPLVFQPSFALPADAPMDLSLQGKVEDKGLLAAIFPEAVQKSQGRVGVDLRFRGTRSNPELRGAFTLKDADLRFVPGMNKSARKEEKQKPPESMDIGIPAGEVNFEWNGKGFGSAVRFDLAEGGWLKGKVSAPEVRPFDLPQRWEYTAAWEGVDLVFLRAVIPSSLDITGKMSGQGEGKWLPGQQWQAAGNCRIIKGSVSWQAKGGAVDTALEKAEVAFDWQEERARGDFSVNLTNNERVQGKFLLPLPARLPLAGQPAGQVEVTIQGKLQEHGFLAALAPEWVRSSRGALDFDLAARGTWEKPRFSGTVKIKDAEARIRAGRKETAQKTSASENPKKEIPLALSSGVLKGDWSEQGLRGEADLIMGNGGQFQAEVSSREPARMAVPPQGEINASWKSIDAGILQPLISEDLSFQGGIKGNVKARWSSGYRLDARGDVEIASGSLMWQGSGGSVRINIAEARAGLSWKEESLSGDFRVDLSQYGSLKGNFELPLAARIPAVMQNSGPIRVSLEGQVQEKGLLAALLPGMVQESRGEIKGALKISGSWGSPRFDGDLSLSKAGGYLPAPGVTLEELSARIKLKDDQIRIETFQAKSGPGQVKGTAILWLKDWRISRYEGSLEGDNFQTVRLPELQIQTSPRLTFQGGAKQISVRGEIQIPEFLLQGKMGAPVNSSPDVILMDEKPQPRSDFGLDIRVRLVLGKRAFVRIAGVNTQLEGALDTEILGFEKEKMNGKGEIRAKEGEGLYTAYGVQLKIVRGRLIFAGPLDRPSLDILALRQIRDAQKGEEIKAGVRVTGDIQKPLVKLYSEPSLGETDILSYMVLGRPFNQKSGDMDLIGAAAGALIRQIESVTLQDRMKRFVKLDTMDIQSGGGDVRESIVTIGKYVNPNLYLSLGKSIFSNSAILTLRYEFSKAQKWEVATRSGDQSGVYLYYRLEFE